MRKTYEYKVLTINYKSIEDDAIFKLKPFLNMEIQKHTYIKYST